MGFLLSAEEIELMCVALTRERKQILRDIAECHHLGHSPAAITLCHRRAAIDNLLDRLQNPVEPVRVLRTDAPADPPAAMRHAA